MAPGWGNMASYYFKGKDLVCDKSGTLCKWGKYELFNKQCWDNWVINRGKNKLDFYLTPSLK